MDSSSKSRGSFVDRKRKSLTLTNIFSDVSQEKPTEEKPKHSVKSYLESLRKEKKEWKDLLKEKRNKLKLCEEQSKVTHTITAADVEKFITPEDEKFLKEKPNYLEMMESVRKYTDAVNYLNKYTTDITDYYNLAINELQINEKTLVEEMCASDLCEICNLKNCSEQEHKFIN